MAGYRLLTRAEQNPKTAKGMREGYMTFPLHLAPADLSGFEVCAMRSVGCTKACLNTAGRGRFDAVQAARVRRTRWFFEDRVGFMSTLAREITKARGYAARKGYKLAIRLNATSDIAWHRVTVANGIPGVAYPYAGCDDIPWPNLMNVFPDVQFYDYTKVAKRLTKEILPANYHVTFSLSEAPGSEREACEVLAHGHNVAVVFRNRALVERLLGTRYFGAVVIDGDQTDLRFLDPANSVVALYAKGKAKADTSGFVRDC